MLVRIVNLLIGALLAAGGGYLVWTERGRAGPLFPPGPEGEPWLLILGIAGSIAALVFIAAAIIPRPKRAARQAAASAERKAKLGAAESYYSDPARAAAADRDWRSGDLPPPPKPAHAPEPLLKPAPAPAPLLKQAPAPVHAPEPPVPAMAKPTHAAVKPVATSSPPAGQVVTPFPSTATLAPIPASGEAPPPPPSPAALSPPAAAPVHHSNGNGATLATPPAHPPAGATSPAVFDAIRAALAAGQLEEADRLLTAERDKAQGEALAELTGLAGDHAAAAGRQSNAKWLWRLALKRFGECNAMGSPAARAVSERLRLADN